MLKLRFPSSLPPLRTGTLKGLCCTPHTDLDLQKRNCSEHNRKKCKTSRDKHATSHKYSLFLMQSPDWYLQPPQETNTTAGLNTHFNSALIWGVTPEPCQTEKDHFHCPSLLGSLPAACARALLPNPTSYTVYVNLTAAVRDWAGCSLPINGCLN